MTVVVPTLDAPEIRASRHRRTLSRAEAETLTAEIRSTGNRLWMLVAVAYERKAWKALGYDSWRDYVAAELEISESRSYQLVDTGRVMLTIADATGADIAELPAIPARSVAAVKDRLPQLRRALRDALDAGEEPTGQTIVDVVAEVRADADPGPRAASRSPWVDCPVCAGKGQLGRGEAARELASRAARWVARVRG